ncbi:MAG: AtpZ/AtpI family protein [Chthonomonadetes bacterium]|nr:AtpZ/AtpI family protein [Chthonomonadetes bacterium]
MSSSSSTERTPDNEPKEQNEPQFRLPEVPEPPEVQKPDIHLPGEAKEPVSPVNRGMRAMALASTIGLSLVVPPVLGYFAGRWLDGRFGTDPILSMVGLIVGIILGFVEMVQVLKQIEREERKER